MRTELEMITQKGKMKLPGVAFATSNEDLTSLLLTALLFSAQNTISHKPIGKLKLTHGS